MNTTLKKAFDVEIATACRFLHEGNMGQAMWHLERAHVLGQRYVVPHVRTHWIMLRIGLRRHSAKEVWGQAVRIVFGALGSAIGIVPTGNTGGTDIHMFKRLPITSDIAKLLDKR